MGRKGRDYKRRAAATTEMNQVGESVTEFLASNSDEKSEDEYRRPFLKPGQCQKGICGKEAACLSHPNNTYSCICPHDKSPPTKDWRCTRITVPPTPHPIKNIRLSTEGNSTSTKNKISHNGTTFIDSTNASNHLAHFPESLPDKAVTTSSLNLLIVVLIFASITIVSTIFVIISCKRKKSGSCLNYRKTSCTPSPSPIVLKRSLLVPERYAPNPQYSACSSASIPILQRDALKFLNEIGEGCFGKVFKGELQNENGFEAEIVAIKVLKESASREVEEDFFREVDIMSSFRHKNILSLLGVVLRESGPSPMMVFEYMAHGDLAELLRAQKQITRNDDLPHLDTRDLMSVAMQIASGMSYLAAQRFVHRDLACRNCLVAAGPTVKIADFGMSRDVYTCDYYKIGGSRMLPVRWMSPESVMYGRFTLESDIWSYGIVLWEIYSYGKQPYYGHSNEEVVKLILQGIMLIPPENCPSIICELMKACWKTDPRDRIKFVDIYEKLEKVHNAFGCSSSVDKLNYENEIKSNANTLKKLPRPPPLITSTNITQRFELLDQEGYLLPKEIKEPVKYLDISPLQD